jgi:hypothetical protein
MKNETKQTAVEYLVGQIDALLELYPSEWEGLNKAIEQAKEMEKQQIMEAHYAPKYGCFSEDYYNETYGGNK